jgi:NAD(P)-dependent dehydrogenase (short-subunit alcohol dehydrogenase family)
METEDFDRAFGESYLPTLVITGGSRGIGRACALLAAERGWDVAFGYQSDDQAADETLAAIRGQGVKAFACKGDAADEAAIVQLFDAANNLGPTKGVIVNAGIVALPRPLADMDTARIRRMFDINTIGAFLCAREAARRLPLDRGGAGGAIVLVSSAATRLGSPFEYVDYAASKAALDTLTIGLSKELARQNVRVNAVRPGLIETQIHESGGQPDRTQRLGASSPMGRPGRPQEIAQAILWLISDEASYTTGAILDVTGGR